MYIQIWDQDGVYSKSTIVDDGRLMVVNASRFSVVENHRGELVISIPADAKQIRTGNMLRITLSSPPESTRGDTPWP